MSGASITQVGLDAAIAEAIANGFDVVRGDDHTLLLDIDSDAAMAHFERTMPVVAEHFLAVEVERWKSKSGNTHIRLSLPGGRSWAVRYALQAALGSDGLREALAIVQMENGCDEAAMLFKPRAVVEEEIAF